MNGDLTIEQRKRTTQQNKNMSRKNNYSKNHEGNDYA